MISRLLSLLVGGGYLVAAYFFADGATVLRLALYLVLPLACIWFSEALGDFTGPTGRGSITSTTPGCMVAAGGWLLLLLPLVIAFIEMTVAD